MTDLVVRDSGYSREQVDLIKRTVAKDASDDELKMFLHQAKRTGLDPFARQIHFTKRGDRSTIIVGIDGYRLIADRTGMYAGNDDPVFVMSEKGAPELATVTVWKMVAGQRVPFSATARWTEYAPDGNQGFMWRKMPFLMLGKVAEALALRKAFPADLSGVYVKEEMDQAEQTVNTVTGEIIDQPKPQPQVEAPKPTNGTSKPPAPVAEGRNFYRCTQCQKGIEGYKPAKGEFVPAQVVAQKTLTTYGAQLCLDCARGVRAGTIVLQPVMAQMADDDDEPEEEPEATTSDPQFVGRVRIEA
jgi:phage recombination protein Bet